MKQLSAPRQTPLAKILCMIIPIVMSGCGDSGEANNGPNSELGDIAAYTQSTLRALAADGASEKAIQILRARSETRTATIEDYILLAEIHIERLEPAEASSALERAEMLGATKQVLALQAAETLMLQGQFSDARNEIQLIPMIGLTGYKVAMLRGKIEAGDDDVESARRFFGAAGRLNPRSPDPEIELALLDFAEGDLDTAFDFAEKAKAKMTSANEDSRPDYILGAISRLRRENEKAITYLERALAIDPDAVLPKLEMLGARLDANERESAQKILDDVIAGSPNNAIAQFYVAYMQWQDGDNAAAQDLIMKTDTLLSNYRPAKKLYANAAFDEGDYEVAARYFRQYLTDVPGDIEVRLKLANSLQKLGQSDESLRIVTPILPENQSADELSPEDQSTETPLSSEANPEANNVANRVTVMALSQAGSSELAQNNVEAARQKYTQALVLTKSLDPAEPELARPIAIALATIEFNTGDRDTGIQLMTDATALGSPTPKHLTTLANMQILASKLDDAAATLARLNEMEEAGPIKDNLAGTLAMRHKNYDAAITAFSTAIEANPDYLSAIKNRAAAYIANNMFSEALADLTTLTPHATSDGQYYAMLARTQQRLGNFTGAINAFEAALKLIPKSASLNANYAVMLGEKERYEEAVVVAKKTLTLLPYNSPATTQIKNLIDSWETIIERQATLGAEK